MKNANETKYQFLNEFINESLPITELLTSETQRKLVEEELRNAEERLMIFFDCAFDAYYLKDLKGKIVDVNQAAEEMIGYKREELIGKDFSNLKILLPEQIQRVAALMVKNVLTQSTGIDEFTLNRKDGSQIIVEIKAVSVKIKDKPLVLLIARDITEPKRAKQALRAVEEKFWKLVENMADAFYVLDKEGNILYVNKAIKTIFGFEPGEVVKRNFTEFVASEVLLQAKKNLNKIRNGKNITAETVMIDKAGKLHNIEYIVTSIVKNGKDTGFQVIARNINERKMVEELLLHERDYLISILGAMEDGVYIVNQQFDIKYVNYALRKEFGQPDGKKCYEYFYGQKEVCSWCKSQDVFAGKTVRWKLYYYKNQKTYDIIDMPLKNPDGSLSKLEIFRNITEQK